MRCPGEQDAAGAPFDRCDAEVVAVGGGFFDALEVGEEEGLQLYIRFSRTHLYWVGRVLTFLTTSPPRLCAKKMIGLAA